MTFNFRNFVKATDGLLGVVVVVVEHIPYQTRMAAFLWLL